MVVFVLCDLRNSRNTSVCDNMGSEWASGHVRGCAGGGWGRVLLYSHPPLAWSEGGTSVSYLILSHLISSFKLPGCLV